MNFYCLDERKQWYAAAIRAAEKHGYAARRIFRGDEAHHTGVGFIRPHADPHILTINQRDYEMMSQRVTMIQDPLQVIFYENKSRQFLAWHHWMPPTWRFTNKDVALAFLNDAPYPLVSKADVGASSVNVRVFKTKDQAERHVRLVFDHGVEVNHCSDTVAKKSRQKDYVLLQQFIPHTVTWRVNAIGDARAAFRRFCYPNRPVAQTGNVEPVMEMTDEVESLFDFSNRFFAEAQTKWCAIDVLKEGSEWKLLETSLAWPWPSPGRCNEAPIFGSQMKWIQMFDVMFDQLAAGAWAN